MVIVLLTLAGVLGWQLAGFASVWVLRSDLAGDTRDALINIWLWPLGWVATGIWLLVKRRRERRRQERISAKVAAGEYDPQWARTSLHWKG